MVIPPFSYLRGNPAKIIAEIPESITTLGNSPNKKSSYPLKEFNNSTIYTRQVLKMLCKDIAILSN